MMSDDGVYDVRDIGKGRGVPSFSLTASQTVSWSITVCITPQSESALLNQVCSTALPQDLFISFTNYNSTT